MIAGSLTPPAAPRRRQLIQNAVYIPSDGVWLKSRHAHDYQEHTLAAGGSVAVDGGLEYTRRLFSRGGLYEDWSLYLDDSFERICERLLWGTYGPNGDQPRRWVPLSRCELEHLRAIRDTQSHIRDTIHERVVDYWIGVKGAATNPQTRICDKVNGQSDES